MKSSPRDPRDYKASLRVLHLAVHRAERDLAAALTPSVVDRARVGKAWEDLRTAIHEAEDALLPEGS